MKKIIMIGAMVASLGGCNYLTKEQVKALNEDHRRLNTIEPEHQDFKHNKIPFIEQEVKKLTESSKANTAQLAEKPSKDYVDGLYMRMGNLEAQVESNDTNARLAIASIARRGHQYVTAANQPVVLPPPPADPDEDVTPLTASGSSADPVVVSTASAASPPTPTAAAAVASPADWQGLIAQLNEQQADLGVEKVRQKRLQEQAAYFITSEERFNRAEAAMKAVRGEVSRAHARLDRNEAVDTKQGADIKDLQQQVKRMEAQQAQEKKRKEELTKSSQLPQRRRVYDDAYPPYYGYTVHRPTVVCP